MKLNQSNCWHRKRNNRLIISSVRLRINRALFSWPPSSNFIPSHPSAIASARPESRGAAAASQQQHPDRIRLPRSHQLPSHPLPPILQHQVPPGGLDRSFTPKSHREDSKSHRGDLVHFDSKSLETNFGSIITIKSPRWDLDLK